MRNYIFGLTAIVIAFAASAFTVNTKVLTRAENNKLSIQNWYFNVGQPLSNAKSEANYGTTSVAECNAEREVPCRISFEANDYLIPTTNTPLQNYLDAHPTVNDVLLDAKEVRSE
ncbi:hypothetical protein [Pedobacter sp. BMA]|uniref:hypothetical protein n=1 Tax=Pedobacter sp. BMA TaxID=1663685 RepID=UPI00064ABD5F|nr:hypothetical protein [Pedobacter sp. BMA]KLT67020.1 hypothetical protein AB669_03640 [Pedobacter sp. BMA]